jgi:hypothetical protein
MRNRAWTRCLNSLDSAHVITNQIGQANRGDRQVSANPAAECPKLPALCALPEASPDRKAQYLKNDLH